MGRRLIKLLHFLCFFFLHRRDCLQALLQQEVQLSGLQLERGGHAQVLGYLHHQGRGQGRLPQMHWKSESRFTPGLARFAFSMMNYAFLGFPRGARGGQGSHLPQEVRQLQDLQQAVVVQGSLRRKGQRHLLQVLLCPEVRRTRIQRQVVAIARMP